MESIPVWVVGGYLGAGKTTLLNALLREAHGVRFAVLVNDFGSVNVDAELLASTGADTIALTNGCTCCTIGGDLIVALKELLERGPPPERIVIEASGIADPRAVARLAACHPALTVQRKNVVADAETNRELAGDKYVGELVRRQLGAADAIVLSKVDLVDPASLAALREWFGGVATIAPIFEAANGSGFPADIAFDAQLVAGLHESERPAGGGHAAFASLAYRSANPLDRSRFFDAVRNMIPAIARAKGTVRFADSSEPYLFQLSGERWSIEPFATAERIVGSRVVVIALSERAAPLEAAVAALGRAELEQIPAQ